MEADFSLSKFVADSLRVLGYATDFYLKRLGLIVLFSIPLLFALLILGLAPAPTYIALGGAFLRTGSIPELSLLKIILVAIGYIVAVFLIADTIVNVNIIIRSKRTLTAIRSDIVSSMGTHAMRILYISIVLILVMFIAQLLLYGNPFQSWIYPLFLLILSYLLFFVPQAVVIDNSDTLAAISRSARMALRKPGFFILWTVLALVAISIVEVVGDFVFPGILSSYFVLLVNSLFVLPYLLVLQTQMYMEKYPLAK
jgi:hypothetical protein